MLRLLLKGFAIGLVAAVLGLAAPAAAAPHVDWQTADFYFDGTDKPVVTGFFVNDGTETAAVVAIRHEIFLQKGDGEYFFLVGAVWTDLNLILKPGERSGLCRLRVADYAGPRHRFDRFRTRGDVTFRLFRAADV